MGEKRVAPRHRILQAGSIEFSDKAPATPKLNVIAVDELPSVFECGVVIRGNEPMREQKMTVKALNVVRPAMAA